ncbi:DUF6765 family protein [Maridesulfovibrio sp. FT414]|uniref:DUF6765 family protein n=1 Tax=Maridesulfovibrio sp. FT414 TaxID=2979469 RepID=UPI003D8033ED
MQRDMHYYGTYVMARAAGIKQDVARIIASAAQFVDDNAAKKSVEFKDGGALHSRPTAHHAVHLKNLDREDQRFVWVPFHFLPGCCGDTPETPLEKVDFTEKLVCRNGSKTAEAMVNNHLDQHEEEFSDELIGITAHVLADTYSHYGFSGVSSRYNKIVNDSFDLDVDGSLPEETKAYLHKREKEFRKKFSEESGWLENIKSWFAETLSGALGHGPACTFPDRPYLKWKFTYEDPERPSQVRDNPATFLQACKELHKMFADYASRKPAISTGTGAIPFGTIEAEVDAILRFGSNEGDQVPTEEERSNKWIEAVTKNKLLGQNEDFPEYLGIEWLKEKSKMHGDKHSEPAKNKSIYQFYQAASYHRHYVLRKLLPKYGLIVA